MSKRASIVKALSEKFKVINGTSPYNTNLYDNSFPFLKFWDEVQNFPSVYVTAGNETREYMPSAFSWGFLNVCIKVYCKSDNAQEELENLLEDIERVIDNSNGLISYDSSNNSTAELSITSITTDEGLLVPYAVGEIYLLVRYEIIK